MELNRKQLAFCTEYLIDYNQRQAALRAGYGKRSIDQTASRLMSNVKVREFIERRKQRALEISDITVERVARELANIAFSNVTDFIEVGKEGTVTLTDWSLLSKEQTACIESVNQTKEGYRLKLYSKAAAIEMLGKYLVMFDKPADPYKEPDQYADLTNAQLDQYIADNSKTQSHVS